jgi:hypothetical protein
VTFFDGFTSLGSAPVSNGAATLVLAAPRLGDRALSAVYSGDNRLLGCISPIGTLRVLQPGAAGVENRPDALSFAAPSPNPSHGGTLLRFSLPREAVVSLRIHDVSGRLVRELAGGTFAAGAHTLVWDLKDASGAPASGGVYFARFAADGAIRTARFVVLR